MQAGGASRSGPHTCRAVALALAGGRTVVTWPRLCLEAERAVEPQPRRGNGGCSFRPEVLPAQGEPQSSALPATAPGVPTVSHSPWGPAELAGCPWMPALEINFPLWEGLSPWGRVWICSQLWWPGLGDRSWATSCRDQCVDPGQSEACRPHVWPSWESEGWSRCVRVCCRVTVHPEATCHKTTRVFSHSLTSKMNVQKVGESCHLAWLPVTWPSHMLFLLLGRCCLRLPPLSMLPP